MNQDITTIAPKFRKLEDLNLIDNFLFQQMLSQEGDGEEFARILLSTILGRQIRKVTIVPQKNILGIDTDKHGIRLDAYIKEVADERNPDMADVELIPDIYDIEPNNCYEKKSLPKRTRYYHGLIDTQLLSTGSGYEALPNVVIIMILPYDPFGKNRMVYTVRNSCVEDPTVDYNDGATKIFLYTKGTEGKPSQELKDMLKYIEKSTFDNITNQDIASLSDIVEKVKHKKEVSINYMKSWEYEKMIKDEAFESGFSEGRDAGFSEGRDAGFNVGFSDGFSDGFNECIEQTNQLIICLTQAGRIEDIIKVAQDPAYREQLIKEFHLELASE